MRPVTCVPGTIHQQASSRSTACSTYDTYRSTSSPHVSHLLATVGRNRAAEKIIVSAKIGAPQKLQGDRSNYVERLTAGEMITIGKLVWEIIKEGEPVLDFQSERLGVLPKGIKTASELTNWKKPVTSKYKVVYENMLGFEMVSFEYRLIFTPGGKHQGKGHYLTNIAIEPSNIEVSWGYNLNAQFEALDIVNLAGSENPMAGMELQLTWSVDTLIHKSIRTPLSKKCFPSFFIENQYLFL